MIDFYPQIKMIHVAAVMASGTLFLLRGIARQAGGRWAMAAPARYLSYGIDTVLLVSALMLVTMLPPAVFASGWLTVKLGLLVAYVVLGVFALRRGRTARSRLYFFVAALAVFASMFAIARTHHPLGPWLLLQNTFR